MAMGRPRKHNINKEEFEQLCSLYCTLVDVAGWFKCSEDTIERFVYKQYKTTFADIMKRFASKTTASIRRKQIHLALEGDRYLLIWLGKQYLGQSDKIESNVNQTVEQKPVVILPSNGKESGQSK